MEKEQVFGGEKGMKWYQLDYREVLETLQTSEQGLSESEVKRHLEKHGPNKLPEEKSQRGG